MALFGLSQLETIHNLPRRDNRDPLDHIHLGQVRVTAHDVQRARLDDAVDRGVIIRISSRRGRCSSSEERCTAVGFGGNLSVEPER